MVPRSAMGGDYGATSDLKKQQPLEHRIGKKHSFDIMNSTTNNKENTNGEDEDSVVTDSRKVLVPDDLEDDESVTKINWKKLWIFLGPGFLMSIAYLDPGNIESDLRSGSVAGYRLLWVLLMAHILGLLLQRLSARLGVVSGKHMAEVAYFYYPKIPRIILWLMVEVAIIGSDMQEVIGTAIALYLLSNASIPIWVGVIVTIIDTMTFLLIDRFGFKKLEAVFCFLIAVMAITFGYEFGVVKPDVVQVVKGTVLPYCENCGSEVFLQAVGCIGAVIMPHNLYLHSALVQSRKVNRKRKAAVVEANKYFFIESGLALLVSFFINLLVVSVFGTGLNEVTNVEIRNQCVASQNPHFNIFPADNSTLEPDIYSGGVYLGCRFGAAAMYIWAIGILAAGQSSTMAGCYAGQFVMEGFMQLRWKRWKRVLFTRSIAIVPTLFAAVFSDLRQLTRMNDILNALMMVQLPFALVPLLTFASSEKIMHSFRTSLLYRSFFAVVSCLIVSINVYFMYSFILDTYPDMYSLYAVLVIFSIFYFCFVFYLVFYCAVSIGAGPLKEINFCKRLFPESKNLGVDAPWLDAITNDEEKGVPPNNANGNGNSSALDKKQ